ncbi:hypothetical protein BJ944DRAFT_3196 [Cunninghamella echinulata]|nr:hypothetical protein BJ944DRAFT_3196 [Cunninghamella echinulata]
MNATIDFKKQQQYKYSRQELLALKASPLVSKPESLPLLSQWFSQSHSKEYIRPKQSHSTPIQRNKYSTTQLPLQQVILII